MSRWSVVAIVVAGMLIAACGQSHQPVPRRPVVQYGKGELRRLTCQTDNFGTRACGGLIAASPAITDSIHLDKTRVVTGNNIKGTLIVTNASRHTIKLLYRGCRPAYGLALTNGTILASPAFAAICTNVPLTITPGVNKFPVTVSTSYQGCTRSPEAPGSNLPQCIDTGEVPPLPPGKYLAALVGLDLALPPPEPVSVMLVSGSW